MPDLAMAAEDEPGRAGGPMSVSNVCESGSAVHATGVVPRFSLSLSMSMVDRRR
jgi:hypothetical protein